MDTKFKVNDRVNRIEERENVSYRISYDEGGFGYWFESDLMG